MAQLSLAIALSLMQAVPALAAEIVTEIRTPQRLSAWLLERRELQLPYTRLPDAATPYLPGLVWTVPEEVPAQEALRQRLLQQIRDNTEVAQADADGLAALVASLPATGRVVVEQSDARWLEANPRSDPMLQPGQRLRVPLRPATVTVVLGNGQRCVAQHAAMRFARDYLRQCPAAGAVQQVWIVQPDGLVQRAGVAGWNESSQNEPAPGAWIVVQSSAIPWPSTILEQLARLLATQGVAPEPAQAALAAPPAHASNWLTDQLIGDDPPPPPRDNTLSWNDWGTAGLLQTPTARMFSAGTASMMLHRVEPYQHLSAVLQPLDWLELGLRWTYVRNRRYGPESFSGTQAYLDKSADVKIRLWQESAWLPELALGVRDMGGTGLFAGEYLVASKRNGDFDWSLGLGWGYLGARGDFGNPLAVLGSEMDTRSNSRAATGGTLNNSRMFHGRTALFGGVQYQTPWQPLLLKLEYDGNDYQHEPQFNNQPQSSPVNLGLVYRPYRALDLNLSWERGTTLGFGFTLHDDLSRLYVPKLHDPVSEPVSAARVEQEPDWAQLAVVLEQKTSWRVLQIERTGKELVVRFEHSQGVYWQGYLDRIVSVLHRFVPSEVETFRIQSEEFGLKLHEFTIHREAWLASRTTYVPVQHRTAIIEEQARVERNEKTAEENVLRQTPQALSGSMGVYFDHSFGGPEGFLYRIGIRTQAGWRITPGLWWAGSLLFGVLDNYDRFRYPNPLNGLPHVRTDVERYVRNPLTMPFFQLTHVGRLGESHFYSLYGGMLESMYGGIGFEWLYRPWQSPVALGMNVNSVRQRAFQQDFGFRDYRVITGHVSLYWDTGYEDVNVAVHAGQYLAGDRGATLEVSRTFRNGVRMAAFATKTNVSAEVFGEGSFDKGVYVSIPLDAMLTRSSAGSNTILWHPLLRDGGARLDRAYPLFELTQKQSGKLLYLGPPNGERSTQFGDVPDVFE